MYLLSNYPKDYFELHTHSELRMEGEPIATVLKAAGVMAHRYTKKNTSLVESSVQSEDARIALWLWMECRTCEPGMRCKYPVQGGSLDQEGFIWMRKN